MYHLGRKFTLSNTAPLPLTFGYSANTDGVFVNGFKIEEADLDSFEPLSYYYAKDKNNVYFGWEKLPGAATSSFEIIGSVQDAEVNGVNLARDAKFVYVGYDAVPLNPKTVRVLGDNFTADDTSVYFVTDKVEGADQNTFTFLGFNYGVDASGLWSGTQFITSGTSTTGEKNSQTNFRYLGDAYVTDGTNIYSGTNLLVNAELATFNFIPGSYYAYDANTVFYGYEVIATTSKGFTLFGTAAEYVKTDSEVFLRGIKIEGADPVTFTVSDDGYYATDKTGKYVEGERMTDLNEENYTPDTTELY